MALWGNKDQANNAPKYTTNVVTGQTGVQEYGNNVFAVDTTEQSVTNNPKGGHAGWVRVQTGTGGRAGRVHVETLVAMGSVAADNFDANTDPFFDNA